MVEWSAFQSRTSWTAISLMGASAWLPMYERVGP